MKGLKDSLGLEGLVRYGGMHLPDRRPKIFVFQSWPGDKTPLLSTLKNYFGGEYKINFITTKEINSGALVEGEVKLLVLPGGESRQQARELGNTGGRNIEKYLALGGNILGICAGAYLLTEKIIYEEGGETIEAKGLGFLNATAEGVIREFKDQLGGTTAVTEIITEDGDKMPVVYIAGPCFKIPEGPSLVKVLARYADVPGTPPAVIGRRYEVGQTIRTQRVISPGLVIAAGPHIEMTLPYFENLRRTMETKGPNHRFRHNTSKVLSSAQYGNISDRFIHDLLQNLTGVSRPEHRDTHKPEFN